MSDPVRWSVDDENEELDAFERSLLRAGRSDQMPDAPKRALLAAAAAGTWGKSTSGDGGAGTVDGAGPSGAGSSSVGRGSSAARALTSAGRNWGGWLGMALAVSAVGGGLWVAQRGTPEPVAAAPRPALEPDSPPRLPSPAVAPYATAPSEPTLEPAMPPTPATRMPAGRAASSNQAPARSTARGATPPSSETTGSGAARVAEEAALLDHARNALAEGDVTSALDLLGRHTREFPHPALADEAFVLRIEAHAQRGSLDSVRDGAEAWISNHPGSPYVGRLRRVLNPPSRTIEGGP